MLMMTGRGPVNRAGGRYRTPEIVSPSKLFHFTISGSGSESGSNAPNSLFVHRSSAPVRAFTEKTSAKVRSDESENATSLLSDRQAGGRGTSWPAGSLGAQRTLNVLASRSSTRLLVVLSKTTAIVRPSGESAKDSRSSVSPVIGCHFALANSPRHSRRVSESRLLRTYT